MKVLNYILLTYFSIGALIPRSDFSQMGLLDDLLKHYELHQSEAQNMGSRISFMQFLYDHFISGVEHQHPNENEHHNLPLYSISSGMILFFEQLGSFSHTIFDGIGKTEITSHIIFYLNPFINQVFHPPSPTTHLIDF